MSKVKSVHHHHSKVHAHHNKEVKKGKRRVKKDASISANELPSDVKAKKAAELVLKGKGWASEGQIRWLISHHGEEKVKRMLMACRNIQQLPEAKNLSHKEIFDISKYIEVKLKKKVKHGKVYLRADKTGLARAIEYKSGRAFIHLDILLGQGCHKKVTRSIMYAAHSPKVVANCEGDKTVKFEGKIVKKLHGAAGVVETYAVSSHKTATGKKVYSMITKLYNSHSVRSYEFNRNNMNHNEEVYIACDLMKGLESMHAKRLAHRDLHSGNFMVNREEKNGKTITSAALIDFGQVVSFDKAKKMAPRIEVSRHLITPESLIKGKHRVDVRKIESFAVGCSLYHLYFGLGPEWCDKLRARRVSKMSKKSKKSLSHELVRDIRNTIDRRQRELDGMDTKHKKLGEIILKLLDPDPKKRYTPHAARKMLESVIQEIETKKSYSSS